MGSLIDGKWVTDTTGSTLGKDGSFQRQPVTFRNWVTADGAPGPSGTGGFRAESGRYHLYVSLACPWAHRTLIFRALKGLEEHVSVDVVHPDMLDEGWSFATDFPGATGDSLFGSKALKDIYTRADPGITARVTVPVLWDRKTGTIVSNESADIIRMFNSAFDGITGNRENYCPKALGPEIDAVNTRIYDTLNNGVYRCGFARSQSAYDTAVAELFDTLDWLESRLSDHRYLVGGRITEADWRLAPTLFRFDAVYHGHFKCSRNRIVDFPNLWAYARELYQWPGIAKTVDFDHIRRHYHYSHESINRFRIVPMAPRQDWMAPHRRDRLAAA
ncbi:glutathione S-transferase family protein [Halovulum dunhuangense]|uniref:Glutathione S-transferase family protein n=1 Tax=Halovulum dunhuangense TaxID=1505036 RepID=A0A849KVC0_9RHOB|nr:glutathione S-transferase family protein [Halovulum dunhuangense]NNU79601.1 glutathione S-transferase family protein [Halovulum dunhuangense]